MGPTTKRRVPIPAIGPIACGLLAIFCLLALSLPAQAQSQVPNYNLLFGSGGDTEQTSSETGEAGSGATAPRQSRPAGNEWLELSADDYARVAQNAPRQMVSATQKAIKLFRKRLIGIVERSPEAFEQFSTTLAAASPTGRGIYFLGVAVFAGLLLVVGQAVAAFYIHFVARPVFVRMQSRGLHGYLDKLPVLVNRVLLSILGLIIVVLIATAVGLFFYEDHEETQLTVITVFGTYAAVTLVDTTWRVILAPFLPGCRLVDLGDADARRLYRWLTVSSGFGVISSAFCYWVLGLGLPREMHVLVTVLLMAVTVSLFLALIKANALAISGVILGGRSPAEANWLSRVTAVLWAPLGALYLLVTWADLSFRLIMGIEGGPARLLVPYVTLIAGVAVYAGTIYVIERVFARQRQVDQVNAAARDAEVAEMQAANDARWEARADDAMAADGGDGSDGDEGGGPLREPVALAPGLAARGPGMHTMEDLARRVASLFALGAFVYVLTLFWFGLGALSNNPWVGTLLELLQVAFLGYIAFHATRIWLDRKIEDEGGDVALSPGDEGGGAGASRLATLLPLVRNFILTVILTIIALIMVTKLGANVAPLFAGAGIVGLAIGFGSQALVRDILSGAFFLLDDAFRKGEYIDVGNVKGTVEKISLRSFQLRHHLGMLHTIPFGEIQHLTNFSRDWVMMKLPLRLTYDTDIEKVRKLIKKLGQELLEDPVVGDKFMQPLKSQGVIQMDDSAMIARIKFMTKPGDQWVVRKRVFAEIRELFEREGIHFAHREVTVRIPDLDKDRPLDEDERKAIGAAARNALDVVEAEQLPRTGTGSSHDDR